MADLLCCMYAIDRLWELLIAQCKGIRIPEPEEILLVESGTRGNFACGVGNLAKFCSWNLEPGEILLVKSGTP